MEKKKTNAVDVSVGMHLMTTLIILEMVRDGVYSPVTDVSEDTIIDCIEKIKEIQKKLGVTRNSLWDTRK